MSSKFLWSGLSLVTVSGVLGWGDKFVLVGAILMVIGAVLLWQGK